MGEVSLTRRGFCTLQVIRRFRVLFLFRSPQRVCSAPMCWSLRRGVQPREQLRRARRLAGLPNGEHARRWERKLGG